MTFIRNEADAIGQSGTAPATALAQGTWIGPPLRTLQGPDFDRACAQLMQMVEAEYSPTLVVGIRTGGLWVAQSMVRAALAALPVLPLTCRRATTEAKARLPLLRTVLGAMPRSAVDLLRRLEHRFVTSNRAQQPRRQEIDHAEVSAIAAQVHERAHPTRILVVDDAVDSGLTLATVLGLLRQASPADSQIRSAAITQTLPNPAVRPDYVLFQGTLCRFPWSFDAAG